MKERSARVIMAMTLGAAAWLDGEWTGSCRAQGTGLFVFPHVDAHGRGIPGVTRPMMMAGTGMMGMGGMGMPMANPNWTGAAAMFAPELLMRGGMMQGMGAMPMAGTPQPGLQAAFASGRASPSPRRDVAAAGGDDGKADARLLEFQKQEARKGSPGAQRALAARYEKGDGVERSDEIAKAWREAADRSERMATMAGELGR